MARRSRKSAPDDPRALALALLGSVLIERRPFDETWSRQKGLEWMEPCDRAFARTLVATTLRRLGQIDALLDHCLERPLKPKMATLRNLLRLGACQLLFLGTPAHAAVDTTVRLAQGRDLAGFRGLVNAVLRRLGREGAGLVVEQDEARLNTPDWLWQSWCDAYGEAAARAIAAVHLQDPPIDLTLKEPEEAATLGLTGTPLPGGSLRLAPGAGDITGLPGFPEGRWWVQDAAAALPARLLGPVAGQGVIDLCAAPGGKTAQLAAAGAKVTALDQAPSRLALLRENLHRLRLEATVVEADATTWQASAPADAVLLDAPCSATGTLRRHPDIAHLKGPEQIAPLTLLQDRLLTNALTLLRPGGLLVYATCSLQPEEGSERIAALLASGAPVERVAIAPDEIGGLPELIDDAGDLRSLPCHLAEQGGLDGFYACRLRRLEG